MAAMLWTVTLMCSWLLSCTGAAQQLLPAIAAMGTLIKAGAAALVLLHTRWMFEVLQAHLVAAAAERRLADTAQQGSGGQQLSTP